MTIKRMAIGMVDTERTCLTCALPAAATPAQVEWPARDADLRREASTLKAKAKAMRAEAARVDGMGKVAKPPAFLCSNCRTHLHDPNLTMAWLGGFTTPATTSSSTRPSTICNPTSRTPWARAPYAGVVLPERNRSSMSRSPKSPQYGNAGDVEAMIRDVEAPVPPRVDRPSRSYVEGRGEGRITGPSATPNQLGDHARQRTPRFTEELRSGVNLGTPTENTRTRQENGRIACGRTVRQADAPGDGRWLRRRPWARRGS